MSNQLRLFAFCILIVGCCGNVKAQQLSLDSLKKQLNYLNRISKSYQRDTLRVHTMLNLSTAHLERGQDDESMHYAEEAGNLASSISYKAGVADGCTYIGHVYAYRGDFPTAQAQYQKSLKIFRQIKNQSGIAHTLVNLGNADYAMGNHTLAVDRFYKALSIYKKTSDKGGEADIYNSFGIVHTDQGNYDSALFYYSKSLAIQEKLGDKHAVASAFNNIGLTCHYKGDFESAMELYRKSLAIGEQLGDKAEMALSYNNMGLAQYHLGNYDVALDYHYNALKLVEELGNEAEAASSLNNIGIIHHERGDLDKAFDCYTRSIKIRERINDLQGIAHAYNNLGLIYEFRGELDSALDSHDKALKLREQLDDKQGIGDSYSNIGNVHYFKGEYDVTIDYYLKALAIFDTLGDRYRQAIVHINIGSIYRTIDRVRESREYLLRGLEIGAEISAKPVIVEAYKELIVTDSVLGNFPAAFNDYKMYILYRDSIHNEQSENMMMQRELEYEFGKKAAEDSVASAKQAEIQQVEIDKQNAELKVKKNQQYALFGGLALLIVFAVFMYNRFRITRKQKAIIEIKEKETFEQKVLIEEKHKEITDSINYAERIQRSFLASDELLRKNLGEYFVLFQPKDVVSGDFYWAAELRGGDFIYVTADSTGHGVPGAIMSILNISSLEKAVESELKPASILNKTRELIVERLKKDGSAEGGKDGMDCSAVVLSRDKRTLTYAAAHNPVWIVRANEVIELAADKMPVGKHDKDTIPFSENTIELKSGDVIYTLTDGMPDQFGGPKGKKLKHKPLKEFLLSISQKPMAAQKELLAGKFSEWRGELEQVDDVCVIGVRI